VMVLCGGELVLLARGDEFHVGREVHRVPLPKWIDVFTDGWKLSTGNCSLVSARSKEVPSSLTSHRWL
jgi:hypothetical protein